MPLLATTTEPPQAFPFARLLLALVRASGGEKQAFARAVRISPASLSRQLAGTDRPLETEACLRIAHHAGVSASRVLRAAGRGEVADLLEDLYGEPAIRRANRPGIELTISERDSLAILRALAPREHRAALLLLRRIAETRPATARSAGAGASK